MATVAALITSVGVTSVAATSDHPGCNDYNKDKNKHCDSDDKDIPDKKGGDKNVARGGDGGDGGTVEDNAGNGPDDQNKIICPHGDCDNNNQDTNDASGGDGGDATASS
ncbi:hypothetical protein [Haladaptatus caseinilyticus]|uniref:hypothetical protein n=1 Tax=Haladaptatus caseinilyticus TaxID=2993314 RepID=UPI00224B4436|nr:hypothetical protein [Haladaptatus caseinilyticus]